VQFKKSNYQGRFCEVSGCQRVGREHIWFPVPGKPIALKRMFCYSHAEDAHKILDNNRRQ